MPRLEARSFAKASYWCLTKLNVRNGSLADRRQSTHGGHSMVGLLSGNRPTPTSLMTSIRKSLGSHLASSAGGSRGKKRGVDFNRFSCGWLEPGLVALVRNERLLWYSRDRRSQSLG